MNTNSEIVINLEHIWFEYDGLPILEDVNISVKSNDFLGIIGPNGAGKTTLLKIIIGLLLPDKGKVSVLGMVPREARKFIGYVPQVRPRGENFPITVWDAVLMGRLARKKLGEYYNKTDREITLTVLETVGMVNFRDRTINSLSEGEKQRIFIARALTGCPKLLLLDEPTANVDTCMQRNVYELLMKLKEKMAIILVSHDIGGVSRYVEKIACLNHKLFYHDRKEISLNDLEAVYSCPVDLIAHGIPHRVFEEHSKDKND